MREFFGMVLGCALTILIVYLHDAGVSSNAANDPAQPSRMIVNWSVASGEWSRMEHNARVAWDKLTSNIEKART
jgi:hypothetical protein